MDASKLVEIYIKIRDKRSELSKEYEAQDKELVEKMNTIEAALLTMCKENEIDSIRTKFGTATRTIKERAMVADWDAFKEFVREYDAIDLLVKNINQSNFKEWAEQHPDVVAPVNIDRRYAITVRRAT